MQTLDKNTIICAHGRSDKTMFGTLKDVLKTSWLNNTDNYVVKLSTEYENSLWQIFSAYHIPTTSDYLTINFNDDQEFIEFTDMLISKSQYDFNTTVNEYDHILTLSTCYNNSEKMVIHAKLIKKQDNFDYLVLFFIFFLKYIPALIRPIIDIVPNTK